MQRTIRCVERLVELVGVIKHIAESGLDLVAAFNERGSGRLEGVSSDVRVATDAKLDGREYARV